MDRFVLVPSVTSFLIVWHETTQNCYKISSANLREENLHFLRSEKLECGLKYDGDTYIFMLVFVTVNHVLKETDNASYFQSSAIKLGGGYQARFQMLEAVFACKENVHRPLRKSVVQ